MSPIHQYRRSFYCESLSIRVDVFLLFLVICVALLFMVRSAWAQQAGYQPIIDNGFLLIDAGERVPVTWLKEATRVHFQPNAIWGTDKTNGPERMIWISGEDIAQIRHARRLEELAMGGADVSGRDIEVILKLPRLKRIEYTGIWHADDEVLKVFGRVKALERLVFTESQLADSSMASIGELKHLKYLDLENTGIKSSFFKQGVSLPGSLTHLRLDEAQLDNSVILLLPKGLTHLSLSGTGLKPDVIPLLKRFQRLEELSLFEDDWNVNDYERLKEQLPGVKVNSRVFSRF
ncbi:hypothetical protein [Bremerella cremea]|uniref:hypothetical protein n=2 Tax=Bremerella cremea TaxID=1031537 RepID=UPI0031EA1A5F